MVAVPAAAAPAVVGVATALSSLIYAQVDPAGGTDVLNYGAVGVLGLAFLYMIYALSQNRIVSRDAATNEAQLLEHANKLIKLLEESMAREDRLAQLVDRQLNWLEGRGGASRGS